MNPQPDRRELAARARRQLRAAAGGHHVGRAPEPGSLVVFTESRHPVQWVVVAASEVPQATLELVPADPVALLGTGDLSSRPEGTESSLTVRCRWARTVPLPSPESVVVIDRLPHQDLHRIVAEARSPRTRFAARGVDDSHDYQDWIDDVVQPAMDELEQLSEEPLRLERPRRAAREGARSGAWTRAWTRAAAAALLVGLGFAWGTLQTRENRREGAFESTFVPLSAVSPTRAGKPIDPAPTLPAPTLPVSGSYSLLFAMTPDWNSDGRPLRLDFTSTGEADSFEILEVSEVAIDGRGYVSVVVPAEMLAPGEWQVHLSGAGEALVYRFRVD